MFFAVVGKKDWTHMVTNTIFNKLDTSKISQKTLGASEKIFG